jgi:hypothetical protein
MKPCKNVNPIEKFIGAWQGEALIRCNQGEFEVREQLK